MQSYQFFQGKDSPGDDFMQHQGAIESIKRLCNKHPECRGFNTSGQLKNKISPEANWTQWTDDPTQGLYVKQDLPAIKAPKGKMQFQPDDKQKCYRSCISTCKDACGVSSEDVVKMQQQGRFDELVQKTEVTPEPEPEDEAEPVVVTQTAAAPTRKDLITPTVPITPAVTPSVTETFLVGNYHNRLMFGEVIRRLLKYLVEGLAVALAAYYIPKKSIDMTEISIIAITAAATFAILDMYSPTIAESARSGAGFGIGYNMV